MRKHIPMVLSLAVCSAAGFIASVAFAEFPEKPIEFVIPFAAGGGALAVAYAGAGQFKKARQTAQRALKLARESNDENLTRELEARLKLYRNALPYREH